MATKVPAPHISNVQCNIRYWSCAVPYIWIKSKCTSFQSENSADHTAHNFLNNEPSASCIHRLRVSCNVARSSPGGQQLATPATASNFGGWPAHVLFRGAKATMRLKVMRQMREARRAFTSIMDLDAETIQRINSSQKTSITKLSS